MDKFEQIPGRIHIFFESNISYDDIASAKEKVFKNAPDIIDDPEYFTVIKEPSENIEMCHISSEKIGVIFSTENGYLDGLKSAAQKIKELIQEFKLKEFKTSIDLIFVKEIDEDQVGKQMAKLSPFSEYSVSEITFKPKNNKVLSVKMNVVRKRSEKNRLGLKLEFTYRKSKIEATEFTEKILDIVDESELVKISNQLIESEEDDGATIVDSENS